MDRHSYFRDLSQPSELPKVDKPKVHHRSPWPRIVRAGPAVRVMKEAYLQSGPGQVEFIS